MRSAAPLLSLLLLTGFVCATPALGAEKRTVADLGRELTEKYRGQHPAQWGEHLPGIVDFLPPPPESSPDPSSTPPPHGARLSKTSRAETPRPETPKPDQTPPPTLALTLDACEGGTDMRIIALLRTHSVPATVFVTNRWLRRNPAVAAELAADPLFSLACHGKRHKPASVAGKRIYGITGTRTVAELVEEVEDNARAIEAITGKRPLWYRSGTAYYDDVALKVIADLGLAVAGYAVSADQGATLPAKAVARAILKAPDRAVILCHLNHPESGTYEGLATAIPALRDRGAAFVSLETAKDKR